MLDEYERVAVALFDSERARLYTVYLGAIEERRVFDDDVPRKQATGDWFGLAQTRYSRHREDHIRRHAQRTARALTQLLRERPFERLLLGGPEEALAILRHALSRPLRQRLAGTLHLELFAPEGEVLAATLRSAETIERERERAMIDELIDAATARHVALGLDDTLEALNAGRVHRLFLASGFAAPGGECPRCARLTAGAGTCPICGAPVTPIADLAERAAERALEQGAWVEVVAGEAAAKLLAHGGMGAWTRY